jgi:EAL domain-containing protein (putative c-di-GMP-specific phosphodiesterase class I)
MLDANRRFSNSALLDSTSIDQSIRLREIMTNGLTPAFQPVYTVGERMPFGVEGVIRGPAGSALEGPDMLFQVAQDTGMILALDEAAYLVVLERFAALQWSGKLFLNLRPSSLVAPCLTISNLRHAIATVGLHPSQIILELTEHEPIRDTASLLGLLDPLFDEGMTLALDDVGAGFASMRAICELQPHLIKVDRFFITGIADDMVKQRVVQNFINLASDIGAKIVAEGVEQDQDAWTAMQLGVDFVQGYLFASATEIPTLIPLAEGFWDALQQATRREPHGDDAVSDYHPI